MVPGDWSVEACFGRSPPRKSSTAVGTTTVVKLSDPDGTVPPFVHDQGMTRHRRPFPLPELVGSVFFAAVAIVGITSHVFLP